MPFAEGAAPQVGQACAAALAGAFEAVVGIGATLALTDCAVTCSFTSGGCSMRIHLAGFLDMSLPRETHPSIECRPRLAQPPQGLSPWNT